MQFISSNGVSFVVDEESAELVASRRWRYAQHGNKPAGDKSYLTASIDGKCVYLHRLILGAKPGQIVDHRSGDTLDCRRSNLRFVTSVQNMHNREKPASRSATSRFKGVTRKGSKWGAGIRHKPRSSVWLGSFESEIEAAFAYDVASLKYHGEFGKRNFLPLVLE